MNRVSLAKIGLIAAGIMLALETVLGSIIALGIGFEAAPIPLGIALAIGFPVYLLALRSVRAAAVGLWTLFLYRWIVLSCFRQPCQMLNPVLVGTPLLPVAALLVTACAWTLSRLNEFGRVDRLLDVLRYQTARAR